MTGRARILVSTLLGLAVAAVAAVLLLGGDKGTTLKLRLDDASGLRDGSPVSVGGVRVGKVKLGLGKHDAVDVELKLDEGTRVPRDAQVGISAVNFLGQKQVAFTGGDPRNAAPDGYAIPTSRVTQSTDLDQVLDTLDADTRTRLAIVVNEAGTAVAGRKWDLSRDFQELPKTLSDAHVLLSQLVTDNHTLSDLVSSSDRVIASATRKRTQINELIDTVGQTSQTVETKRGQLAATLAKAPGTLATLRRFLGELQKTTVPLGPAARDISATAPSLDDTLSRVESFRKAADPTLKTATDIAPTLTRLGTKATPVVRKAQPTLKSLAQLVPAAKPLTDALDGSADNLIATVDNWAHAVQLRDGLSHIFRGEATFSPDLVASALDRLTKPSGTPAARKKTSSAKDDDKADGSKETSSSQGKDKAPDVAPITKTVTDAVDKVVGAVTGATGQTVDKAKETIQGLVDGQRQRSNGSDAGSSDDTTTKSVLDYLLKP